MALQAALVVLALCINPSWLFAQMPAAPVNLRIVGEEDGLWLSANPASLSFGNVSTGSTKVLPVTLLSSGPSSVTILNVSVSGAGFSASGIAQGQVLPP